MKEGPPARLRLKILFLFSLFFSVFLIVFSHFGEDGIVMINQQKKELRTLEEEVSQIKEENKILEEEIELLKYDAFTIERIAREDLGMGRENEMVYEFLEKK